MCGWSVVGIVLRVGRIDQCRDAFRRRRQVYIRDRLIRNRWYERDGRCSRYGHLSTASACLACSTTCADAWRRAHDDTLPGFAIAGREGYQGRRARAAVGTSTTVTCASTQSTPWGMRTRRKRHAPGLPRRRGRRAVDLEGVEDTLPVGRGCLGKGEDQERGVATVDIVEAAGEEGLHAGARSAGRWLKI